MTNPTKNPDELAVPLGLLLTNSTRQDDPAKLRWP